MPVAERRRGGIVGVVDPVVRRDLALLAALTALAIAPILTQRHLPLFDYPAHLVVPAALRHRDVAATRVAELYRFDLDLVPNSAHYAWTWLFSHLVSIEAASALFLAVMCVAALPAATAFALRSFGRDARLAALVVPLCWGRCFWYGFVGFCAAVPASLVAIALLHRELIAPRRSRRLTLAVVFGVLPFLHFFVMAVTCGLAVVLVAAHLVHRRTSASAAGGGLRWLPAAGSVLPVAVGPALMAPWFLQSLAGDAQRTPGGGARAAPGALEHLLAARPPALDYLSLPKHWFLDAYPGHLDDVVAILVVLTLAYFTATRRGKPVAREVAPAGGVARAAGRAPLWLAAALLAGYIVLPFEIRTPFHWWAMNVRLLPLLFAWLVVATPPGALRPLDRLALAPVSVATAAYLLFVHVDLARTFNGPWGMAGLDDVLSHAPEGASVSGLYTDYRAPMRYQFYPFLYASSYAVVRGGGVATPFIPIPQSVTNPRSVAPHPVAGDAALFRLPRHGRGVTHFLVRTCAGPGCVADPFEAEPAVRLVHERHRWRLYECLREDCAR